MANLIQIKRSSTATNVPGSLAAGELAINTQDEKLFYANAASTVKEVDLTAVGTGLNNVVEDTTPQLGGFLDCLTNQIVNLGDPSGSTDAATKGYVDSVASGLDVKKSVRVLADSNIDLTSAVDPGNIDGVTLANEDRILLTGQSSASENGIYSATIAANPQSWVRASDADQDAEVNAGMFTFIEEGTAYADTGWVLSTNEPFTLGVNPINFTQFTGAGQITAGDGLTKTGNTINAVGTASRISVAADSIDIDAAYAGQASITTLGTIATGTWTATAVGLAYGGTGADLSAVAASSLLRMNSGQTALEAAVAGTDYLDPNSTVDGGTF